MDMKLLLAAAAFAAYVIPAVAVAAPANPVVIMKTSLGDITIELDATKAPLSVKNFLAYVDAQFYNGTIFHRIIKGFMIQGGGLTPDYREKAARPPIKNESGNGLKNTRGAIAMARTEDLNSATCQFYINLVDNVRLDELKYCAFGKVVAGLDVVDAIAKAKTGTKRGQQDVPWEPITILSIEVLNGK